MGSDLNVSDIKRGQSNLERNKAEQDAITEIRKLLGKRFKRNDDWDKWLKTPVPELGGYHPAFFIKGRNAVKILDMIKEGKL